MATKKTATKKSTAAKTETLDKAAQAQAAAPAGKVHPRPNKVEELLYFSMEEGFLVEDMGRPDGEAGIDALRRYVCSDYVDLTDAEVAIGAACIIKHVARDLQKRVYDKLCTDPEFCACLKSVIAMSFAERDTTPFKRSYEYIAAMCDFPPEKTT